MKKLMIVAAALCFVLNQSLQGMENNKKRPLSPQDGTVGTETKWQLQCPICPKKLSSSHSESTLKSNYWSHLQSFHKKPKLDIKGQKEEWSKIKDSVKKIEYIPKKYNVRSTFKLQRPAPAVPLMMDAILPDISKQTANLNQSTSQNIDLNGLIQRHIAKQTQKNSDNSDQNTVQSNDTRSLINQEPLGGTYDDPYPYASEEDRLFLESL